MNDPRRKVLKEAVCLLVAEVGFATATEESIETLTEMLQSCKLNLVRLHFVWEIYSSNLLKFTVLSEIANQTRCYTELAGRTQAVVGDVVMALVELGIDFKHLDVSALEFSEFCVNATSYLNQILINFHIISEICTQREPITSSQHESKQKSKSSHNSPGWSETVKSESYSQLFTTTARCSRLHQNCNIQAT